MGTHGAGFAACPQEGAIVGKQTAYLKTNFKFKWLWLERVVPCPHTLRRPRKGDAVQARVAEPHPHVARGRHREAARPRNVS